MGIVPSFLLAWMSVLLLNTTLAEDRVGPDPKTVDEIYPDKTAPLGKIAEQAKNKDKIIVAVIDTGFDYNHPEIAFQLTRPWKQLGITREEFLDKLKDYRGIANTIGEKQDELSNHTLIFKGAVFTSIVLYALNTRRIEKRQKKNLNCEGAFSHLKGFGFLGAFIGGAYYLRRHADESVEEEIDELEEDRRIESTKLKLLSPWWDFANDDPLPEPTPRGIGRDHGTSVAGVAGGRRTEIEILPIRVNDLKSIPRAVAFAKSRGARVINLSMNYNAATAQAISDNPDLVFVNSAGNDSANLDKELPEVEFSLPKNLIFVASHDKRNAIAQHSNYGKRYIHIAAPGVNVRAPNVGNTYGTYSGTSLAAPAVAQVAARILARNPNLTPREVRELILSSATRYNHLTTSVMAGGILNEKAALEATEKGR